MVPPIKNLKQLTEVVNRLHALLADPHPGLDSWYLIYEDLMQAISNFWNQPSVP